MKQYDYLIVGAGLYGAVFAHEAKKAGKRCLVIDKRAHIAGNIYTEEVEGINVHRYGAHIFHTNNKAVWQYVNQFAEFNRYTNSPVANYHGEIYNLPFNMNTFNKMWGVVTPAEAKAKIEQQRAEAGITEPKNLEEQAISLVGTDIYEKLIKGYTGKQWGRPCTELPAFIIKRLPVRFTYDDNYFNALYQGIPGGGYTAMVEKMLDGVEVRLGVDYLAGKAELDKLADRVVYTGPVDAYFGYKLGALQYRSVRFVHICTKFAGFHAGNRLAAFCDDIFIEGIGFIRSTCFDKAWTVALFAVGIQCELRNQKKAPVYICKRKVGLSVFILENAQSDHFFDQFVSSFLCV